MKHILSRYDLGTDVAQTENCKHCHEWVDLDKEGHAYPDGSCSHEHCHDNNEFESQNSMDWN
ncbi:MAG: hypothetical protein V3V47_01840 [Desulfobacteria bacterium]